MQYLLFPACLLIGITISFLILKVFKSINSSLITSLVLLGLSLAIFLKIKISPSEGMRDLAFLLNSILILLIVFGMWIHIIYVKVKKNKG